MLFELMFFSIFVSHRMFRKNITDNIVVLQDGKISEIGMYDSLMSHNGDFSRLLMLDKIGSRGDFLKWLRVPQQGFLR